MAKLKPWYHVVTPREDLRENRPLDASEFAVHLDHVRYGRAHEDYTNPIKFFDRTFMTKALSDLCAQVVRRLAGIKVDTSAVFNMSTQFGGGKTHSLTALYHLAHGGDAAKGWQGVESILRKAQVPTVEQAAVAVLMGKEFDSITGRGGDGEPVRKTPWGEIAWQLGGIESFKVVEQHERDFIEPKGDVIRAMLPRDDHGRARPTLILFDEIISYVSTYRSKKYGDRFYNFLDALAETARGEDNLVVVASIPASDLEYTAADSGDEQRFKKMLDRLGRAIMMSADTETAEIFRRRLFEWHGVPDDGKRVVTEYADWAVENAVQLSGVDAGSARELFAATYPFHPSVLSVFERKWQSLPRFQRTRGILRLLAIWVSHAFQKEHQRAGSKGDHLIGLGSAPIEDPAFRAAMFEQLGTDALEGPVTTDIAGKSDAWSMRLDKEASDEIKQYRLHQKVATTVLFESNGGQSKDRASVPEIKMAVGSPESLLPNVETALEELVRSCYYLSQDGSYYRFSLSPNLNKILTDRRAGVSPKLIDERLKQAIQKVFKEKPRGVDLDVRYWPTATNGVPDRPALTLVVLGPESPVEERETPKWMERLVRECGTSGRTMKSAVMFVAAEGVENMRSAIRDVLAWEAIDDEPETKARLDSVQKKQLTVGIGRAERDLNEAIWRAYRHVYFLDKHNRLTETDLGQINSSMGDSPVGEIVNRLERDDELVPGVGPNKLLQNWPPALERWPTKGVRDAFYSSPVLRRLKHPDAVKRTIADGVTEGLIGYARDDGSGGVKLGRKPGESFGEGDVEIADDVFILKADEARRLLDPPRLTRIDVAPSSATVNAGEKATFTAEGKDQYGQSFQAGDLSWSATGGSVDGNGVFAAGEDAGAFIVKVKSGDVEGSAQVRVAKPGAAGVSGGEGKSGEQLMLQWSGDVPPQKWMNFYTKVLSRYASTSGLKLTVRFEVPVDPADSSAREQEARAALRDLGLDEGAGVR